MIRALFVADQLAIAELYARECGLGYDQRDWRRAFDHHDLRGIRDIPVFVCGPAVGRKTSDIVMHAHDRGLRVIYFGDITTARATFEAATAE